jgi:hypothetical protein
VTENSLPLYLFHSTGIAIVVAVLFVAFDYLPPAEPTTEWWLTRPIWLLLPLVATYPFLRIYAATQRARH